MSVKICRDDWDWFCDVLLDNGYEIRCSLDKESDIVTVFYRYKDDTDNE